MESQIFYVFYLFLLIFLLIVLQFPSDIYKIPQIFSSFPHLTPLFPNAVTGGGIRYYRYTLSFICTATAFFLTDLLHALSAK